MRRASKANLQETRACWVSHCQSLTGSSHWDSLSQPGASVHLPNVPPESNTHWIESGEKGKCLHKAGERKALRQGVAGANNGWARGAELQVRRRQPRRWSDTMLWPRPRLPGGASRADKEIAREVKRENPALAVAASIAVKWSVFIQRLDYSEHFALRSRYSAFHTEIIT